MSNTKITYKGGLKAFLKDKEELLPYWDYKIERLLHNETLIDLDPSIVTVGDLYNYYEKKLSNSQN